MSSFGVFLALGFLVGIFLIWRLSRAWDLDEEKVLDLTLLTFLGGLAGARLYFVLENLSIFATNIFRAILINKYPGFSFWGAILGGWLTLYFLARKKRLDFWQLGDIAAVGFLASYILTDLGCFLGGCEIGVRSNLLAVNMVGHLGKRFPVQILEAVLLVFALLNIWSKAIHFHTRGKIVSLTLIYLGAVKFLMEPFKHNHEGLILSPVLIILGLTIFYKVTRRRLTSDLKKLATFPYQLITNHTKRRYALDGFKKYWYNQKTLAFWKLRNWKKILRRLNVRFS